VTTRIRAFVLVAVLGAASVPVTACSLLVSTSGLTTAEASGDAGRDVTTADASIGDGAHDGGCDAGFCACAGNAHSFCDDFDSVPTGANWTIVQFGAGTIAYDRNDAFSPPVDVLATAQPLMTGNLSESIVATAPQTVTRGRVEVDMAIELGDPAGPMDGTHGFCPISVTLQPGDQTLRLNIYGDSADVEQLSGTMSVADQPVDVPTGTGARARYGLWFDTKARTCGVTVNGVEKMSTCVLDPSIKGGIPSVGLGIIFVRPPTSAWRVRMDNVTADYD